MPFVTLVDLSRIAACSALALTFAACGGSTADGTSPDASTGAFPTQEELARGDYLPTGTYLLTVNAATCTLSEDFKTGAPMELIREPVGMPPGASVVLPRIPVARQDLRLEDVPLHAPGATPPFSITIAEIGPRHLALVYDEEGAAPCSVRYAFDLKDPACPSLCKPANASATTNGDKTVWSCTCS